MHRRAFNDLSYTLYREKAQKKESDSSVGLFLNDRITLI